MMKRGEASLLAAAMGMAMMADLPQSGRRRVREFKLSDREKANKKKAKRRRQIAKKSRKRNR